ncbi:MAG: nucleoid occlusion factor SlmA [bacterium]
MTSDKISRKQQILESMATMLEGQTEKPITTAALAKNVGVSEAALYRHFPSKAKIFEGLIDFAEESLFSRLNTIQSEAIALSEKCFKSVTLLLAFAERNPGIARILTGEALVGESPRLQQRIQQLFDRFELQLKQLARDAEIHSGEKTGLSATQTAQLLASLAEGRIRQFVRSGFSRPPTSGWQEQWQVLEGSLFA